MTNSTKWFMLPNVDHMGQEQSDKSLDKAKKLLAKARAVREAAQLSIKNGNLIRKSMPKEMDKLMEAYDKRRLDKVLGKGTMKMADECSLSVGIKMDPSVKFSAENVGGKRVRRKRKKYWI